MNPQPEETHDLPPFTRRDFAKTATVLGGLEVVAIADRTMTTLKGSAADKMPSGSASIRNIPPLKSVPQRDNEDILIRMQEELRKAMAKPMEQRRWKMVIDQRKCVGRHACTVVCIAENKLPRGVVYRSVMTETIGEFPNLATRFTPRPCMQCEMPVCVPVCPVQATYNRPDGITVMDLRPVLTMPRAIGGSFMGNKAAIYELN